jgi:probable metal-binding protein
MCAYLWRKKEKVMNIVHIHNVLDILVGTDNPLKEEELIQMIANDYGDDVHFASCSDQVFPKEDVVGFLLSKNKIKIHDGLIHFNATADRC